MIFNSMEYYLNDSYLNYAETWKYLCYISIC
jgi:hypothetical protein